MCLLALAWRAHPDYPLVLAGNRDERHARAAAAAGFWSDAPQVLAGRDLEAGGTWLGVTTAGRYAVVTNYREGLDPAKAPRSRGALAADYLRSDARPEEYLRRVEPHAQEYGGFNLLCGDRDSFWYLSNRGGTSAPVTSGLHGLSNHLLDTSWPKVETATSRLRLLVENGVFTSEPLFRLLADRTPAKTGLPDTGIGVEMERRVSAAFVLHPIYGTRCSSALMLHRDGSIQFSERGFDAAGQALETRHFRVSP